MIRLLTICLLFILLIKSFEVRAQHSVARMWNEVLLEGIRNDLARPTVHARNLFHISAAMYDCWAVYDSKADTYFLDNIRNGFEIPFDGVPAPMNVASARNEALSYACYRLITHRFQFSPGATETLALADDLMMTLGYDINDESQLYSTGSSAALGNYLAAKIIDFGLQDGSNEFFDYRNLEYEPLNPAMVVNKPGSQGIVKPNHWQPLAFDVFIDQSGNEFPGKPPDFLSPEWGNTVPFALTSEDVNIYSRDGVDYKVYNDPGPPAYIDTTNHTNSLDYKWGFSLVALWSAHLDPNDGVMWDISPASLGNLPLEDFPTTIEQLSDFYNQFEGGDPGTGYTTNPITRQSYEPQIVPRGDYTRVLAEFWADGPDSETPPGHWFTILNYINDQEELEKRFKGSGEVLEDYEWDVKSYFVLGGAMHDAAISAWSIKGYYDYIRPISALRYMADKGQSSDASLPSYHQAGIPLSNGYIKLVESGDPLAGENDRNVGKIKFYAWKGPDFIEDPKTDIAGVGWILAENWWPYQRPTFVTPPFAGYVSGHSTYSRAAAKVLTLLTGDEYFPGGIGEFLAPKDAFLQFERGPSVDVVLQWAKYSDASDQCSLSRIWGGIHPPVDDIPGRLIGEKVGEKAFDYAGKFFDGLVVGIEEPQKNWSVYPNPAHSGSMVHFDLPVTTKVVEVQLLTTDGRVIHKFSKDGVKRFSNSIGIRLPAQSEGLYILKVQFKDRLILKRISIVG